MKDPHAPYGTWESSITSRDAAVASSSIEEMHFDDSDLWWVEKRTGEGGRYAVRRLGSTQDVLVAPWSAANAVHSYGGAAMAVEGGELFFSNKADGRIYRYLPGRDKEPKPVTPKGSFHYADIIIDRKHRRLIAVREDHTVKGHEAKNTICEVRLETGKVVPIVKGADFYAAPRLSPDGRHLAWIEWRHPYMPWQATTLCVAKVSARGELSEPRAVVKGSQHPHESVLQPVWSPAGVLHFVSDRSGWWNIYRVRGRSVRLASQFPIVGDIGKPAWKFGQSLYAFDPSGNIFAAYRAADQWKMLWIDEFGEVEYGHLVTIIVTR